MKPTQIMLITCEASGDVLAAELVAALREELTDAEARPTTDHQPLWTSLEPRFFGIGGPRMAAAGVDLAFDVMSLSAIGPADTFKNYLFFRRLFRRLYHLAIEREPAAIIGLDSGLFNLPFAHAIRQYVRPRQDWFHDWQPKLFQYVSPQVWASREGRARRIERDFDLLLSIFPFEKEWYARHAPRLRVEFVGNPIVDRYARGQWAASSWAAPASPAHPGTADGSLSTPERGEGWGEGNLAREQVTSSPRPSDGTTEVLPARRAPPSGEEREKTVGGPTYASANPVGEDIPRFHELASRRPLVLLLPGSRPNELRRHLPVMLDALAIIRAKVPNVRARIVLPNEALVRQAKEAGVPVDLEIRAGDLAESLAEADVAIAKTGTVTLECAYFGVPTVAFYKTDWATYLIGRRIVKVKYAAMPNLLANDEVFPEFIQDAATPERLAKAALELLRDEKRRTEVKSKLSRVIATLGEPGASRRAARAIIALLETPALAWHEPQCQ